MNNYNEILDRYENNLIYRQEQENKNEIIKLKIDILNKRIQKIISTELDFNEIQKYYELIENYIEEYNFNDIRIMKLTEFINKDKEILKGE